MAAEQSARGLCSWYSVQVTEVVVKTQRQVLEIEEDHGVMISLRMQQCIMEGREPRFLSRVGRATAEGPAVRVRASHLHPQAPPVYDSCCGFHLLMESLQVVFTSSILQGSSY